MTPDERKAIILELYPDKSRKLKQIAAIVGLSTQRVCQIARDAGLYRSARTVPASKRERIARAVDMVLSGASFSEAGRAVHMSASAIAGAFQRFGIDLAYWDDARGKVSRRARELARRRWAIVTAKTEKYAEMLK